MTNPNVNCLEGMRCPKCNSFGPFTIAATVLVDVTDEGTEDCGGDYEWNTDAACVCKGCDHTGTIATFTEARDEDLADLADEMERSR